MPSPSWMHLAVVLPIVNWAIRLWAIWAVPRRRTPNAARAWLLLILVAPIAGAALYSVFGRAWLPARRRERQAKANELIRSSPASRSRPAAMEMGAHLQATAVLAQRLGAFPVEPGNRVELIDRYEEAIDRLVADVDAARESVHLLFYIFEPD